MTRPIARPFQLPSRDDLETVTDDLVILPGRLRFTPGEWKDDHALTASQQKDLLNHQGSLPVDQREAFKRFIRDEARAAAAHAANVMLHGDKDDPETGLWYQVYALLGSKEYTWTKELLDDLYTIFHDAWRKMPRRNATEQFAASAVIAVVLEFFDRIIPAESNGTFPPDKVRNKDLKRRWLQFNSLPSIESVRLTA